MTKSEILAGIVESAGYVAAIEGDTIKFKVEGVTHWVETYNDDDNYARVLVTFTAPEGVPVDALLAAANDRNRIMKAVKVVVHPKPDESWIMFSIEMFFSDPNAWAPIFDRAIDVLRNGSDEFFSACAQAA